MVPAPLLSRAAVRIATMRWALTLASAVSALFALAAFASGQPLAFLGVFVADIALAALATLASELTLHPEARHPSPEDFALHAFLHCGVLAMLMMSTPDGLPGAVLLTAHQALLAVNARRLPAA